MSSARPVLGCCRVCGISDQGHPGSGIFFSGGFHDYKPTRLRDLLRWWFT